jgi:hypothetical protein
VPAGALLRRIGDSSSTESPCWIDIDRNADELSPKEGSMRRFNLIGAVLAVFVLGVLISADSLTINFEPPTYHLGSIDLQNGWAGSGGGPINPAIDQAVVSNTYGYTSFGLQSWRISNAYTDGAFGTWPFSPSLINEAGETQAQNSFPYHSGGTRQNHFEVQWDFASTVPGSEQPGLQISTAPDRGDGARMSFIKMNDLPAGLSVEFADYQDRAPFGSYGSLATAAKGCGLEDAFVTTTVANGLDRSRPHTIRLTMDFVEGPRNDGVKVYVDGTLRHTGGSWEDYYRWCLESGGGTGTTAADQSRAVDSMIFQARTGGGTAPLTLGKGFLIDNLTYLSSTPTPGAKVTGGGTIDDPVFSPTGDLVSLPALIPSLADPKSQASFGFAVSGGTTPTGNLAYDDHGADVRIKATSISSLSITSPGSSCSSTPGSKHAEFSGMAAVITSTGTTSEPFTVKVDDCGEPGTADTFGIQAGSYCNPSACGMTTKLTGGNIQIH